MEPKVSDIIGIINKIAPFSYSEEWDNSGLQVGDPGASVSRIMISLDACGETIDAAVEKRCQLLLTHHPFLFHPVKRISTSLPPGSLIAHAIKNDLSIVSLHTNYDIANPGINDLLAERIGLQSSAPLKITGWDELIKLTVFVPKGHEEKVLEELFRFSGFIGNYSDCSFQSPGMGSFKPLAGAVPFIGSVGEREYAEEARIEVLLRREDMNRAVDAMIKAHPYEEPAYDLYPLLNKGRNRGLGRIGELESGVSLAVFAERVKKELSLGGLRVAGDMKRQVQRVAVCGGSGASLFRDAKRCGADVLVTGDVKYHDARDAEALGLSLVDIGHFASELLMIEGLASALGKEIAGTGFEAEILCCEAEKDPFLFL